MQKIRYSLLSSLLLLTMVASSCSEDAIEPKVLDGKYRVSIGTELQGTVEQTTRAAVDTYSSFSGATYNGWKMGVLAATDVVLEEGSAEYKYSGSSGSWDSKVYLAPNYTYTMVSYIPKDVQAAVSFKDKKLTFSNLNPFLEEDLLVSVGTVKGTGPVVTGAHAVDIQPKQNEIFFRMDHLTARLNVKFLLASEGYDALRRIEITKVTLGSALEKSKSFNVTCNYNTTSGNRPAVSYQPAAANASEVASYDMQYTGEETSIDGSGNKVLVLSKDEAKGFGKEMYILPGSLNDNQMQMTITYNVYHKESTTDDWVLTRKDATAINSHLALSKEGTTAKAIEAAHIYNLTVKVIPSYLYVLADRDQSSSIVLQTP